MLLSASLRHHPDSRSNGGPVATVFAVASGQYRTQSGWTPDPKLAKRFPTVAIPGIPSLSVLREDFDWPPGDYLVVPYEYPNGLTPYDPIPVAIVKPETTAAKPDPPRLKSLIPEWETPPPPNPTPAPAPVVKSSP